MKTKCEICGEMVPQQDMSKSYKRRCKKCVAELARIDRKAAKQRAENIRQQLEGSGYTLVSPEDRRRERIQIASAAMQGVLSNQNLLLQVVNANASKDGRSNIPKNIAGFSLSLADALLDEIKKRGGCDE